MDRESLSSVDDLIAVCVLKCVYFYEVYWHSYFSPEGPGDTEESSKDPKGDHDFKEGPKGSLPARIIRISLVERGSDGLQEG